MKKFNALILGASYGSLFATKLAMAGHSARLVCLPEEEALINEQGAIVRLPVRGLDSAVEVLSQNLPGRISATSAHSANPADYDLVVLAMQEPQYSVQPVRELLEKAARSNRPCVSIMNMPPLPFLARLSKLDVGALRVCYTDPSAWDEFDPDLMTLASPDPQAFRPAGQPLNVLQVALPTNFKVTRFASGAHTSMLEQIQQDIEDIRYEINGREYEMPVKLKVHQSVFVPLAKWLMLLTGNYRCVMADGMRSIKQAVHGDIAKSQEMYNWVGELCKNLGAANEDLVPFEKYANAANSLTKPSSVARALAAGAQKVERVDKIVQTIASTRGTNSDELDQIVRRVDNWLEYNKTIKAAV